MNAAVRSLISARPPRTMAAVLLAGGGGLLILLGSVLPWVGGADADAVSYGAGLTDAGHRALGSRAGLAGGDAFATLVAGIVAVVTATRYLAGQERRWQQVALLGSGILAFCWAALDAAELGGTAGPDGARLDLSPGLGLYVVLLGAVAVVAAGGLAPRDRIEDLRALGERADRLWARGLGFEAIERQQTLLRRIRRRPGWHDPRATFEALHLARMYVSVGHLDRAVGLVHEAMSGAAERFADDPEGLAEANAEASAVIADANTRVMAYQPQPGWVR